MLFSLVLVALASAVSAGALPRRNGRIIGGEPTTIETYPHMVSIRYLNMHHCGGSIVSAHYIITAGHCIEVTPWSTIKDLTVRAGSSNEGEGGSVHQVIEAHVHENYSETEYEGAINDIAIIRVKEPFVFDDTRQTIKLFKAGEEALPGTMAVITGWGYTENGLPSLLQTVPIPIVSKKACDKAYEDEGGLPENEICAGYLGVGGKDTCAGDSGGPLTINGRLAGIISWGKICALPEYPSVHTEVAAYRDWINKIIVLE